MLQDRCTEMDFIYYMAECHYWTIKQKKSPPKFAGLISV